MKILANLLIVVLLVLFPINALAWRGTWTICHEGQKITSDHIDDVLSDYFNQDGTAKNGTDTITEGDIDCGQSSTGNHDGNGNSGYDSPSTGGGCPYSNIPSGFALHNATPNDHQLEVVWHDYSTNGTVTIRYGKMDGVWEKEFTSDNDGYEAITGLPNGQPAWFSIRVTNNCGSSQWSKGIDPLP